MSWSYKFVASFVVFPLDVMNAFGVHVFCSSDHTLVVRMLTASCEIMLEDAIGILYEFGVIGVITIGSGMMVGSSRFDRRTGSVLMRDPSSILIGGSVPGVLALVTRMCVRGFVRRVRGSVGFVVVVMGGASFTL